MTVVRNSSNPNTFGAREITIEETDLTITNTNGTIGTNLSQINTQGIKKGMSICFINEDTSTAVTYYYYASNLKNPSVVAGGTDWTKEWALIKSREVGTSSVEVVRLDGAYHWIGITAVTASGTATANNTVAFFARG